MNLKENKKLRKKFQSSRFLSYCGSRYQDLTVLYKCALLKLGYYPLVNWMFNEDICFSMEANDYNCGSLIQLAKSIGNNSKLI